MFFGKIIFIAVNNHTESYSYDPVGNRQTGPDKYDSYTYNDGNEMLTSKEQHFKNNNYEYDVNGNIIKQTENIGKWKVITSYTYDDENRLIYVTIQKGDKTREISFAYDPFGRRISQTIEKEEFTDDDKDNGKEGKEDKDIHHGNNNDGHHDEGWHHGNDKDHHDGKHGHDDYPKTTFYIYDQQNIIAEYDGNGKQTASYIHGPNIDEPLSAEIRNTRIYYHADGLGSITTLTNHMGHKVQEYDYDSFGNIKSTPSPHWIKQPFTYTGREFDYDTNLYYYRARYYDPKAGRFITRDPIGFRGGINQYAYVGNNAVNYTDPFGLFDYNAPQSITGRLPATTSAMVTNLETCLGINLIVTGGMENTHSGGSNGPHGRGEAADFSFKRNPQLPTMKNKFMCCAKKSGFNFAQEEPSPPHYHIQIGKGVGGATGELPNETPGCCI